MLSSETERPSPNKSLEKGKIEIAVATDIESLNYDEKSEEEDNIFAAEDNLSSRLKARHISMITLVMVFGTGLFLLSGGSLSKAGPVCITPILFFLSFCFINVELRSYNFNTN